MSHENYTIQHAASLTSEVLDCFELELVHGVCLDSLPAGDAKGPAAMPFRAVTARELDIVTDTSDCTLVLRDLGDRFEI